MKLRKLPPFAVALVIFAAVIAGRQPAPRSRRRRS